MYKYHIDINVQNKRNKYFYNVIDYLWCIPVFFFVFFVAIYYTFDKNKYDMSFAQGILSGCVIVLIAIIFLKKVVVQEKKINVDQDENLIQAKALEQWDLKKSDNEKKALIEKLEQEERDLNTKADSVGRQLRQLKDDVSS